MAAFDDNLLPPEIWREILTRLPVKSVLRCRPVCKSWYSLISCPNFISHYSITNSHDKSGDRVLLHLELTFTSHDLYRMESREHDEFIDQQISIVGSCNGLICLSGLGYDLPNPYVTTLTFFLWNLAIRKTVELPPITYSKYTKHCSHVGFGWDPRTSDYKVMCNVRRLGGNIQKNSCGIFDLSKGVWRTISPLLPSQDYPVPEVGCYVNGAVHCIVLSFNMSDECFREIRMPDCAKLTTPTDEDDSIETQCVAFGGLVHVIVLKMYYVHYPGDLIVDVSESCSIWAMKEYGVTESWIKVSNIDMRSAQVLPSTQICARNFCLWAKGEALMVHHLPVDDQEFRKDLVLYNTGSRESTHVFSSTKCVDDLCHYKESLVLM